MRRQVSLEKTIMLGKVESSRGKGRPNMGWIDTIKEAPVLWLQDLSKAVNKKMFRRTLIP